MKIKRKQERWTPGMLKKMLSNPMYGGLHVHGRFFEGRAITMTEAEYIASVMRRIDEVGVAAAIEGVFAELEGESGGDLIHSDIVIHPDLAYPVPALVPRQDFLRASVVQVGELGAERYLELFIANLKGRWA